MEVRETASAYLAPSNSGPLSGPLGYRQTEAGVIPEEWNVFLLGEILTKRQLGGNYRNSERETQWPLIKMGNLGRGKISLGKIEFVDTRQPPATCDRLEVDDVLFNTRNTVELVGKVAIWRGELPEAYFNSNIMRMEFDESRVSSKRFMNFTLNTPKSIGALRAIAIGTTSVAAIYSRDLVNLLVAVPPKPEQEAIAEALSDADALIESLEQLIAKKRQIKQGSMQALLTGKQRLPGFGDEWKEITLGDLGSTYGGLTGKTKADFGDGAGRYVTFMNVMSNVVIDSQAFERVKISPSESQNWVMRGDLLFNGSSETPEEVALCAVVTEDTPNLFLNSFCFGFRFRDGAAADGLFMAYFLRGLAGRELMKSLAQGSTRYNLSKAALLRAPLCLPGIAEQAAIATILTDMDTEIAELETRLAKTRQLKQGMMQELLTGRIRLV